VTVAQPSRLRVLAASRRQFGKRAPGRCPNPQAGRLRYADSWEVSTSLRTCSPAMNLTLLEITGRQKRRLSPLLLLCVLRGSARALVRLHKKKPGRAQSRRGRGGKNAAEPRMDTVGKPAGVCPRIAPLLGVFKGPLLETGTPRGTRGAKATAIARMSLRFRGSRIFRFDLLTGLEPRDRSAGLQPA